ncbi:hypothetical protein CDES_07530 [Corynebacterium deserti GIMN1.010]|uniref:Uncharacterized protein n=2 Tax=Corynebacterium TaxID=1716 RepID=A0A0M4CG69_9CORY|nr:hypothetical protein CDES_07530 [Corynebacterium deserti GIMN1.010]
MGTAPTVIVTFHVGDRSADLEMTADPMTLGVEWCATFLENPSKFRRLLTTNSGFALFSLFPSPDDWQRLFTLWMEAAGLSAEKLHYLRLALQHLEAIEVDFLRHFQIDIFGWLRGEIPSRRVANLVADLAARPETRFGAAMFGIVTPLAAGEIMLAQSVAANSEAKKPHMLLKTLAEMDAEREEREKIKRMRARGLSA